MSLRDVIEQQQLEEKKKEECQRKKCGSYTHDRCPNCGRNRVMLGVDNKRRCERCSWCIENKSYDLELSDYLRFNI